MCLLSKALSTWSTPMSNSTQLWLSTDTSYYRIATCNGVLNDMICYINIGVYFNWSEHVKAFNGLLCIFISYMWLFVISPLCQYFPCNRFISGDKWRQTVWLNNLKKYFADLWIAAVAYQSVGRWVQDCLRFDATVCRLDHPARPGTGLSHASGNIVIMIIIIKK